MFTEASAYENINIKDAFEKLLQEIYVHRSKMP